MFAVAERSNTAYEPEPADNMSETDAVQARHSLNVALFVVQRLHISTAKQRQGEMLAMPLDLSRSGV